LQTGFTAGIESLLGVKQNPNLAVENILSDDAIESDLQDQSGDNDRLRDRYVRFFWEPVAEGKEPVMPGVLKDARRSGQRHVQAVEAAKSDPRILVRYAGNPPQVQIVPSGSAPGRPTTKFVDVGGKFIDVKDHTRRLKESDRRKRMREKKMREENTRVKSTIRSTAVDRTPPYLKEI